MATRAMWAGYCWGMSVVVGALVLLAACRPGGGSAADSGGGTDTGPGLACAEDDAAFASLNAVAVDAAGVLRVSWAPSAVAVARIGYDDGAVRRSVDVDDAAGQVLIVGAGPGLDVSWWAEGEDAGQPVCSTPRTASTGAVDARIPPVSQVGASGAPDTLLAVPVLTLEGRFATLVDSLGRFVWSREIDRDAPRVRLAADGDALLVGGPAPSIDEDAIIQHIALDGQVVDETPILGGHTDFTALPDGSLAMLGWDIRSFDDRRLLGDTVLERSPEGALRQVWSIYEDYSPDLDGDYHSDYYQADPDVEDWSHANGLEYSADTDAYYVSVSTLSLIVAIDRGSGRMLWSVGQVDPTVETPEGLVINPHSVQRLDDGSFLVFNRGKEVCSNITRFTVDEDAARAELVERYVSPDCLEVLLFGDTRRDDGGRTFISWSSSGRLEELDPDGTSVRQVDLSLGGVFGFLDPVPLSALAGAG